VLCLLLMAGPTKNKKLSITSTKELQILRNVVDIASSQLDLNLTLQLIVKIVTEMTDADSVFIYLFDESKQNLVLMASKTSHKKELGNVVLKVGEGITGWVARENKPVAIKSRAYSDQRFKSFDVLPEDRYEAFLSVPIIYKGKAIGVVNVQHQNPQEYSTGALNLIEMIAKQVGGIIEHARLFEETKKKALQFDALVKVSHSNTSEK